LPQGAEIVLSSYDTLSELFTALISDNGRELILAEASKSQEATRPFLYSCNPAEAIIAALSVQYSLEGMAN
jgi:hypothetical protein